MACDGRINGRSLPGLGEIRQETYSGDESHMREGESRASLASFVLASSQGQLSMFDRTHPSWVATGMALC